jgi:hypothetical protein
MAEAVRKPDVREQFGSAVNTSALTIADGYETPLERVAAMGAAAAAIASGADRQGLPLAAMQLDVYRRSVPMADLMLDPGTPDERDMIVGELGPMVWHIRYGRQHGFIPQAIRLYARWLQASRLFQGVALPVLERFSARILHEWLSDRCVVCGGSGQLEITAAGNLVRSRGRGQRNARFTACRTRGGADGCHGTGRAVASHTERAKWLDLGIEKYDEERWAQRFNAALIWIEHRIAGRMKRPLTLQLGRRTKRL